MGLLRMVKPISVLSVCTGRGAAVSTHLVHLLPTLNPVTSLWLLKLAMVGSIYTVNISKQFRAFPWLESCYEKSTSKTPMRTAKISNTGSTERR